MGSGKPDAVELAIIGIVCCGCKELSPVGCLYEAHHGEPLPCASGSRCIYNPHNIAGGERKGKGHKFDFNAIENSKTKKRKEKNTVRGSKFAIDEEKAREFYGSGMSDGKIAEALGCAPQTIFRWRAKNGLPPNGRGGVKKLARGQADKPQDENIKQAVEAAKRIAKEAQERAESLPQITETEHESKPPETSFELCAEILNKSRSGATENKLLSLLNKLCIEHPGAEITVDGLKVVSASVFVEYALDGKKGIPEICLLSESGANYVD